MTRDEELSVLTHRERIPPLPWRSDPFGISLADVRDANGQIVLCDLNIALAEFIVEKMNRP